MLRKTAIVATSAAVALLTAPAIAGEPSPLLQYSVVEYAVPDSLTGVPGDPERGREIAVNRKKGGCLSCHSMPVPDQFHGEIGPDLRGVANRYSEGELRLRLIDPKIVNPETAMPAFYKVDGLHRVRKGFEGKPILTAQEIEDIVAYLMTLDEDPK